MKRIFAMSPFKGATFAEQTLNEARAKAFCRFILDQGHAPFAPHLIYPRLGLTESAEDRAKSLPAARIWIPASQEAWILGSPETWSSGMRDEMKVVFGQLIPFRVWEMQGGEFVEIIVSAIGIKMILKRGQ